MNKIAVIFALLALAVLVACAPKAPPAAVQPPVAPPAPPAAVEPDAGDAMDEPETPKVDIPDVPPTINDEGKIVVVTEDLSESGEDCETLRDEDAVTIDDLTAANECCSKKLGVPSVLSSEGICAPGD